MKIFILCTLIFSNYAFASGSPDCAYSRDGAMVACGGESTSCAYSSDGHKVACGNKAIECVYSRDGSMVACGGQLKLP